MFKITSSASDPSGKLSTSKHYRLMVAIAALVMISLLTSSGGSPIEHTISNSWEGFIWGIAEPVISLDRLAAIIAVGLLSARYLRGVWISVAFVLATFIGQIIHLSSLNLSGAEVTIAICTIIFGVILVLPTQIGWLACTILAILAGLSQGYADSQAILSADMVTTITYLIGVTLTQAVIIMSVRQISTIICKNTINQILPRTIRWVGLTFCAIGIVFLGNAVI
ncbi:HupE/UreJ family protein [Okeanomitos corallinicola TIOX110]|uniref:HupE/UreJ family protein n=1 Tax=Okeanomitos corallinicola TIOX110 TaxID=3133117 RepID=A0ABZ2UQC8_9CYAN